MSVQEHAPVLESQEPTTEVVGFIRKISMLGKGATRPQEPTREDIIDRAPITD